MANGSRFALNEAIALTYGDRSFLSLYSEKTKIVDGILKPCEDGSDASVAGNL